jgi:hypothetical protein
MRLAAWSGERNPDNAIRDYEHARGSRRQTGQRGREPEHAENAADHGAEIRNTLGSSASQAELIRVALRYAGTTVPNEIVAWLSARGYKGITSANVRTVKNRTRNASERTGRSAA